MLSLKQFHLKITLVHNTLLFIILLYICITKLLSCHNAKANVTHDAVIMIFLYLNTNDGSEIDNIDICSANSHLRT